MSETAQTAQPTRFRVGPYALALALTWTALMGASLGWSLFEERRDFLSNARHEAQISFQKEMMLLFWMTGHSNSAPATDNATTSLDLATAGERALINPAPMLRQMQALTPEPAGYRSHLASLKPTFAENKADPWEAGALQAFTKGEKEFVAVTMLDGQEYMRVMRPLVNESSCQECHGSTDYKIGEIRGGMSVSVPLAPLRAQARGEVAALVSTIGAIWLLGLGAIVIGTRRMQARNLERARTEAVLRDSEVRYRALADAGQALIWTSGLDRQRDYFNQPWLAFTGRTLEQERGEGWVAEVHPEEQNRCREIYAAAFNRREAFSMVYRLRRHDGEFRWIQDNGSPRHDSRGNFVGFIGHCLDITDRKQAEVERERLIGELRDTLAEVKTLSGLLPICSGCKKIRDDHGYWNKVEIYIQKHTDAKVTHGLCPDCIQKYYPGIDLSEGG